MPNSPTKSVRYTRVIKPVTGERRRVICPAMRQVLAEGYGFGKFRSDLLAGLVVGIVALPLAMALAIASGVPPQYGLYTVMLAAPAIAIFGGSRVNVSGPTAAFVVLLAPIAAEYGVGGLAFASLLAGVLLLIMGISGLGRLIQYVPHPVTTGFTAGIAVVIATLQLKDFFGLSLTVSAAAHMPERVAAIAQAFPSWQWDETVIAAFTLVVLIVWPRVTRKIPGPLVAVTLAAFLAMFLETYVDGASIETIRSRFSYILPDGTTGQGIPAVLPAFALPWNLPGPDGAPLGLSFDLVSALLAPAFGIAMLGAIESLLSAVVADGMAGTRHDPDGELFGQGIGNIIGPFFGGIAATGAIARTATNVRSGARSPVAAVIHALFVLAAVVAIGPVLGHLPMAALAALLMIVAWNMSDAKHFVHTFRVAPGSDVLVLFACFSLTVVFDMVIAVGVGVVLAALLFMRRMVDLSYSELVDHHSKPELQKLPDNIAYYRVAGPMFFGAAAKAMTSLESTSRDIKGVILDLASVPVMDLTGLVALESTIKRLNQGGAFVVIAGVQPSPRQLMVKAGLEEQEGRLAFCSTLDEAASRLDSYVRASETPASRTPKI